MRLFQKQSGRAFHPSVIELEETPASPAGRLTLWVIVLLFASGVTWASIGRMDIVAVATGKVVPNGQIKKIQAIDSARVEVINVQEGQRVKKDQVLLVLDDDSLMAEKNEILAKKDFLEIDLQRTRSQLQLFEISQNKTAHQRQSALLKGLDHIAAARWQEYLDALNVLRSSMDKLAYEKNALNAQLDKYKELLPILNQKTENLHTLKQKQLVAEQMYLEQKQQLIETQQDYKSSLSRLDELSAEINEMEHQYAQYQSEFKRVLLEKEDEIIQSLLTLQQQLARTENRIEGFHLQSPVDGVVQQLTTHTIGGVVTAGETVMMIVPDDAELEIEAFFENKDIGFVKIGQQVEIKIDAFPFTKYGLVEGVISHLSEDAIVDEKRGLIFKAVISIDKESMESISKPVFISPGMTVAVEAKTGSRRLIEYFLSPLMRYQHESIRER